MGRFWLQQTVQLEWQKARVAASESPVIRIKGVGQMADGLFDYMAKEGGKGGPPAFQHQRFKSVWLWLATDQRWWVGYAHDKDTRAPTGSARCDPVEPGQLPIGQKFAVMHQGAWEERDVAVEVQEGALR